MADLTYSPTYPVPKFQTTVTFSLTQSGTDFIRVWCTIAPTGSELDNRINSSHDPRNRVVVFEGSPSTPWNFSFDKGGKYTFVAQEYLKGSGYGGGYQGDPNTADKEAMVGAETTLTLHVGQRVTQPIGPPGSQATLVLWVWDNHIRATTKAFHGEDTPAITATAPDPVLKTAIESSTLVAPLATLINSNLSDGLVTGDLSTWTTLLFSGINAHFADLGMHAAADDYNAIAASYGSLVDQKSFIEFVNQALKALRQHVTNDLGVSVDPLLGPKASGPDSGNFHHFLGAYISDRQAVPLYTGVSTFAEAYGALADVWRCFDLHQNHTAPHDPGGTMTIQPIGTLPEIQRVHKAFLTVLAAASPATPPAQSTGVQNLISLAGFKES